MKISICIPTYNRLQNLKICLESCLNQSVLPYEILIGDDSTNDDTKKFVNFNQRNDVKIRYKKNEPSLGQFKNVNNLIQFVEGEYMILIHDDDLLEPTAIEILRNCFISNNNLSAAYGKQKIITESGDELSSESEKVNLDYFRSHKYEGIQKNKLLMALRAQFPNNGYMIKTEEAKKVGYIEAGKAKDACDFYFGVLFAKQSLGQFYFVDKYTAKYRISDTSVSKTKYNNASYNTHKILLQEKEKLNQSDIKELLYKSSPKAIYQAAKLNHRKDALKWYFSKYHRNIILTIGGIKRFLLIIRPFK